MEGKIGVSYCTALGYTIQVLSQINVVTLNFK